jgi:replication factor C small subunit
MIQLTEKYKASTLDDFVGLTRPRAILGKLAESPYESAWLFLGPSGLGKTTMALAFARAIKGEVHHIPSRKCDLDTVDQVVHKCWYTPMNGGFHIVLCDEADQMSRAAQLAFLSKLDTTAKPPRTIFIFTANDTKLLEDRFLSRVRTLKFENPTEAEIAAFLEDVWTSEDGAGTVDFNAIAKEAGLNIRQALNDLEVELMLSKPIKPAKRSDADILASLKQAVAKQAILFAENAA